MMSVRGRRKRKGTDNITVNLNSKKQQKIEIVTLSDEESGNTSNHSSTSEGKRIDSNEINVSSNVNGCNGDIKNASLLDYPNLKENSVNSFHAKFTKSNSEISSVGESCSAGKHGCFACKIRDGLLTKCSIASCDKYYHEKCLENLPSCRSEASACPLHLCLTCYNANSKNPNVIKGQMYKCFKCPTAFHAKDECIIPGSVILTHHIMSCPDHFSPEKQREYEPVTNLLFCVYCGCNQDLLFCNFCPASVHEKCLRKKYDGKKYVCDRCQSRRVIFFNDIVWAKIYNFRWWPATVLNPKEIPASVQKMIHYEGEFPIQFFGTDEYFWTQKGRVYPFVVKNVGVEDFGIEHNFKKQVPDPCFDDAIKLALEAIEKKKVKSMEPVDGKKLPNYRPVKSNRPIGKVQIYNINDLTDYNVCGCKPSDKNPCGYDSLCLNRNMCIECHPEVCESGELCQNQKFVKRQYASVKPFYTEDRGWGLKALEDIKEGHFVIEYMGDLIDEQECDRRIREKQACGDTNFYFCRLDSNRIIDAGPKGNFSRFLNHSCDPNCETQKWLVNGDNRVGIFAKYDIRAGSELTFDYEMDFSHFEKLKCNCKSARCSGLIGKKPQNGVLSNSHGKVFNCTVKLVRTDVDSLVKGKPLTKEKNKLTSTVASGNFQKEKSLTNEKKKPLCYKCGKSGKLLICKHDSCGKGYHIRCVNTIVTKTDKWECPSHVCKKCHHVPDYVCYMCPNAYCKKHVKEELLSNKTFACSYHVKVNGV